MLCESDIPDDFSQSEIKVFTAHMREGLPFRVFKPSARDQGLVAAGDPPLSAGRGGRGLVAFASVCWSLSRTDSHYAVASV